MIKLYYNLKERKFVEYACKAETQWHKLSKDIHINSYIDTTGLSNLSNRDS